MDPHFEEKKRKNVGFTETSRSKRYGLVVYARRVDSSTLVFSLSSHRNSYIQVFCLYLSL